MSLLDRSLDPAACLVPTRFVDHHDPAIRDVIDQLSLSGLADHERAIRVFEFVRDEVRYAFRAKPDPTDYAASQILAEGEGFCVQKAILLAALGRAAEIPTAIAICDLQDETLPAYIVDVIGGPTMYHHGLNAFHIYGQWLLADASLSPDVITRKGYRPVVFDGSGDALLSATTLSGDPHATYTEWRGLFPDFDFDELIRTFAEEYPKTDVAGMNTLKY